MKTNNKTKLIYTHGGAEAAHINPEQQLRRSVMSCMLWEDEFYEEGVKVADHIKTLIPQITPEKVAEIAIEARSRMKLRHVPLLIAREMARLHEHKHMVGYVLANVIQRPDELAEYLSLYWKDEGRRPLSGQSKKGLARAFTKFSEYQLAKYNRDNAIKLRDVLFLCHAKPKDKTQEELFKKLVDSTLTIPDTWEVALSATTDKQAEWTRLLSEGKLGALALLRNLRNMEQARVDHELIRSALKNMNVSRVLPFRFLTAAKYNPKMEESIEQALFSCVNAQEKLPGKTILVVDVSGSMYNANLSSKSILTRADAACSLAVLIREVCENPVIYATAGNDATRIHQTQLVPARRGFALRDAIYNLCRPLGGGGIFLKQVMDYINREEYGDVDRIIVITDEQDCDLINTPSSAKAWGVNNYLINVASAKNGIGYGNWVHIDGFSESVIDYIREYERPADEFENLDFYSKVGRLMKEANESL
jgi:hypothetical protein